MEGKKKTGHFNLKNSMLGYRVLGEQTNTSRHRAGVEKVDWGFGWRRCFLQEAGFELTLRKWPKSAREEMKTLGLRVCPYCQPVVPVLLMGLDVNEAVSLSRLLCLIHTTLSPLYRWWNKIRQEKNWSHWSQVTREPQGTVSRLDVIEYIQWWNQEIVVRQGMIKQNPMFRNNGY